ncbi:MAG: hypothetical protein IPK31_06790 [Chitinophagaceae bacterium]|nr:hypothetical protein [Chitinophagaceae bacterium]
MKRLLYFFAVITASLFLMGCPYETEVPIDKPEVKFPAGLLGKWEPKSSSDDIYTIKKKDDYIITITKVKKEAKPDDAAEEYEAFISDVGGIKFLNLSEKKGEDFGTKKYYLYKLEISPSGARLTLSPVTENIDEKFQTSAELKNFIQQNMKHSFFYDKEDEVYIKAE